MQKKMMVLGFYPSKTIEKPQASYVTKCLLSAAVQPPDAVLAIDVLPAFSVLS